MSDFKTRLIKEQEELEQKVLKLSAFMQTVMFENLNYDDMKLLSIQLNIMNAYLEILEMRIKKLGNISR